MDVERSARVLITGASYGLGAAVAAKVAERGDQVFSLSRTAPEPAFLDTWIKADLGEIDAMSGVVEELARRAGGQLDGIVFNAALADKSKSQWTVAQVERHFRINALGPFALWDSLEGAGLLAAPCNVVLMGSFLQNGNVRQPAYAMSKAALWAWMRSYTMRQDIDDPVTMNMVWPGRVITPANPIRQLPPGDPNNFYPADRVADVVLGFLYQAPGGPRGTVVDLGRS